MPRTAIALTAALLLASCKDAPEHEAGLDNAAIAFEEAQRTSTAQDPGAPGNEGTPPPALSGIPAAFHGRWGLVAGDCGPDVSVAKGLLTITSDMLRFYESVGKPTRLSHPSPDRLEGRFSFSGEGMEWSKDLTLRVDGAKLIRNEHDPSASYTYTRCPA